MQVSVWVRGGPLKSSSPAGVSMKVSISLTPPLQALNNGILNMHDWPSLPEGLTWANRCLTTHLLQRGKVTAKQPTWWLSLSLKSSKKHRRRVWTCKAFNKKPTRSTHTHTAHTPCHAPSRKTLKCSVLIPPEKQHWMRARFVPKTTASFTAALTEESDDIWEPATEPRSEVLGCRGGRIQQAGTSGMFGVGRLWPNLDHNT